ncbi:hypothetical protein N7450_002169 [Penicillium hetheringtonii]|uniref:DUF7770 domain-containing protein n=1 Tax=Penicillium hetheringtonii TaxID=911720 RepID=A0AAD6DVN6_9EURO|nr:hypothetical protein N7450_002169 [Penicillium hetheringtonii]
MAADNCTIYCYDRLGTHHHGTTANSSPTCSEMSTSSSESSSSDEYGVTPPPLGHNLSKEVLNLYVERVRISLQAENYGIDENAHKSAHAVIYLLTSDGNSVELNMGSPSARTFIGKMMIRQRHFRRHKNSIKRWTLYVDHHMLVGEIISILEYHSMHVYRYDPSGLGCRYWV